MRDLFLNQTVSAGTPATVDNVRPGMRKEGWRLWQGILRMKNSGANDANVTLYSAFTDEVVDGPITVAAGTGKSGNLIYIPGVYRVEITVATGSAVMDVHLDGDTA